VAKTSVVMIPDSGSWILWTPTAMVSKVKTPVVREYIQKMESALQTHPRHRGVSANQIEGRARIAPRVCLVQSMPGPWYPKAPVEDTTVMINLEIVERSSELVLGYEGCMSIPVVGLVARSSWIRVCYLGEDGVCVERRVEEALARFILHEDDHLNGITVLDRTDVILPKEHYWALKERVERVPSFEEFRQEAERWRRTLKFR